MDRNENGITKKELERLLAENYIGRAGSEILAAFDEKDAQIEALMKAVDTSALLIMHMQSNDTEIGRLYSEAQQAIAHAREVVG